jgi:phytoene synthase
MTASQRKPAHGVSAASDRWRFPNRWTPPGSSAYYSVRLASAARRDALAALFAWRGEVRSVLDQVSDPGVARIKLDWWRDEIGRTLDGAPRHPLSEVLAQETAGAQLSLEPFTDIIVSTEQTLGGRPHATRDAQRQTDSNDLGALFELMARCEGITDQRLYQTARHAGTWCAQVRRLRDAGRLLREGREVLTADQLAAAGITDDDLASAEHRQALGLLLAPVAAELLREAIATEAGQRLSPALRVQIRIHEDLLDVLRRSGFDVADQRIALTPLRKLWIAWRAAR